MEQLFIIPRSELERCFHLWQDGETGVYVLKESILKGI
jgi:hypothetical protein